MTLVSETALNDVLAPLKCLKSPVAQDAVALIEAQRTDHTALQARIEAMEDAFRKIQKWSAAYPIEVFPEPDFGRARDVLKSAGMTLDAISASNMRHVLKGVNAIVQAVLDTEQQRPA